MRLPSPAPGLAVAPLGALSFAAGCGTAPGPSNTTDERDDLMVQTVVAGPLRRR